MLAKLLSLRGIDALPVEVDVSPGALPKTVLVALPEQAVKESTHRIERAMAGSGFVRRPNLFRCYFQSKRMCQSVGGSHMNVALTGHETCDHDWRDSGVARNFL